MLKTYEAIYENGQLNWLGAKPLANRLKVLVVTEENTPLNLSNQKTKKFGSDLHQQIMAITGGIDLELPKRSLPRAIPDFSESP
jgi:hypothetical protein